MPPEFWTLNFGHLLTIAALLLSFWTAHQSNMKRIEAAAARMSEMETKVNLMYAWFVQSTMGGRDPQTSHGD